MNGTTSTERMGADRIARWTARWHDGGACPCWWGEQHTGGHCCFEHAGNWCHGQDVDAMIEELKNQEKTSN